jgi:hypothetical protein
MISFDDPRFTKPRKQMHFCADSALLKTKDINDGPDPKEIIRRQYGRTNYIGDIPGCEADSIKHSMVTNRKTNPLVPIYQGLDYGDLLPPLLSSLLPPAMVYAPTLRAKLSSSASAPSMTKPSIFNESQGYIHKQERKESLANTFDDLLGVTQDQGMENYYDTGGNSGRGEAPVLSTSEPLKGLPPRWDKLKLDLSTNQGNINSARSGRINDAIINNYNNSSRNGSDHGSNITSAGDNIRGSGRSSYKPSPRPNSFGGEPATVFLGSGRRYSYEANNSGRNQGSGTPPVSMGARKAAREKQEDINSVRDL